MSDKRLSPDEWAAARNAWEADPTLSFGELAKRLGVGKPTVFRRAQREGWERPANLVDLAKKAHARADKMAAEQRETATVAVDRDNGNDGNGNDNANVAPPKNDAPPQEPPAKPAKPPHDPAAVQEAAVNLRAEINDRHRKEWQAARQLSYEAIKGKDFERAKLAKITSETIKIIQEGERKAWGLDAADQPSGPSVVVIERSGAGG